MMAPLLLAVALVPLATTLHVIEEHEAENGALIAQFMNNSYIQHLREREGLSAVPNYFEIMEGYQGMVGRDHHGLPCSICGGPISTRMEKGKVYKKPRTDCGGAFLHPMQITSTPLFSYTKNASGRNSGLPTNAFCELNVQKSCVDAVENEDYMYYAKSIVGLELSPSRGYDFWYCKLNGWLDKEMVNLAHGDFASMRKKGQEMCDTKYAKYNWKAMNLMQMSAMYGKGMMRGKPTVREANYIGAWNCAMGDMSCDATYCAYTYCDLGDNKPRMYRDCPGWTPVNGMRP